MADQRQAALKLATEVRGAAETVWKLQTALEKAGVEFIPADEHKGPGVRLKEKVGAKGSRTAQLQASLYADRRCARTLWKIQTRWRRLAWSSSQPMMRKAPAHDGSTRSASVVLALALAAWTIKHIELPAANWLCTATGYSAYYGRGRTIGLKPSARFYHAKPLAHRSLYAPLAWQCTQTLRARWFSVCLSLFTQYRPLYSARVFFLGVAVVLRNHDQSWNRDSRQIRGCEQTL